MGGCGDSPLTAPQYSILKRSRKTPNSAWSLAAHPCPCPNSCGRHGQGRLRVSAPILAIVLTLHGGRRWPRDPPSTTGRQQAPLVGATAPPCQDLRPRGSCRPKDTHGFSSPATRWTWLSSHSGNFTGTTPGHLLPPLHRGSGVPALASALPTAPEGDPELLPPARASLAGPHCPSPPLG